MDNERKRFRFEVLLERYFTNFHRILLTNLIFAVPSAVVFAAFYFLDSLIFKDPLAVPFLLLSIIPLYPFYAGVVMVCRNIARGESGVPVFKSFLSAVKDNFLRFLLHGVLIYVAAMLSVLSISLYVSMLSASWLFYVLLFFVIVISLLLLYTAFYIPLMTITYDLPLKYIYKNNLQTFFTLIVSLVLLGLRYLFPTEEIISFTDGLGDFGFEEYLMDGVLCFMLFAGAGKVNMGKCFFNSCFFTDVFRNFSGCRAEENASDVMRVILTVV